jgi:hypothetical protein
MRDFWVDRDRRALNRDVESLKIGKWSITFCGTVADRVIATHSMSAASPYRYRRLARTIHGFPYQLCSKHNYTYESLFKAVI